ncbi:tRNA methyltransferase 6 non-catalytic subunit isoform X2 [Xylocopa sonorina]|uniref:tRNA methyltransferase 6 non-catalytic subunit isoform X2 n=1 Tax=Xylocopa sonorina TaxID=1818115 RepID=UPI00403B2BC7
MELETMCESEDDIITPGKYVIVKKLNFKKIYKVTGNGTLMLGKDLVEMHGIVGKRFWTTFEMIPINKGKRMYSLQEVLKAESLNDLLNKLPSGSDNRSIMDDGTSQKLSKEEIVQLQESGKSGKEIVGSLIENNKSFLDKTEYSQEKYLKKKEQKYFKYLTVCKPSLSSLQEVYYKLDHNKIGSLRMDSLAQLLSYSDVQANGLYMLYDSGSQGLPAAAMLNRIGSDTEGYLINLHPGNVPQAMLVHAMNFPKQQSDRLINVNIYSFLRLFYQGENAVLNNISKKVHNNSMNKIKEGKSESKGDDSVNNETSPIEEAVKETNLDSVNEANETIKEQSGDGSFKRKLDEHESTEGASRPFVIHHIYREPLQETYMMLKQKQNVINLRLFSNFLRSYQVLPDRTHPDILTSDTGGYLLTGYLVQ